MTKTFHAFSKTTGEYTSKTTTNDPSFHLPEDLVLVDEAFVPQEARGRMHHFKLEKDKLVQLPPEERQLRDELREEVKKGRKGKVKPSTT